MFILTNEGATVPIDPKSIVYRRSIEGPTEGTWLEWRRDRDAFVSHFSTCKNPRPYSGRNRGDRG